MDAVDASIRFALALKVATHTELYEALLQTYLFAGFPAALESLNVLNNYLQIKENDENRTMYDVNLFQTRGESLCRNVYTNVYEKMRTKLGVVSPELDYWMIVEGYGKTLSRPGLTTITRELISASSLAAMGWENQLYSHVRGAINVGATPMECRALLPGLALLCTESRYDRAKIILDNVLGGSL